MSSTRSNVRTAFKTNQNGLIKCAGEANVGVEPNPGPIPQQPAAVCTWYYCTSARPSTTIWSGLVNYTKNSCEVVFKLLAGARLTCEDTDFSTNYQAPGCFARDIADLVVRTNPDSLLARQITNGSQVLSKPTARQPRSACACETSMPLHQLTSSR